MGRSDKDKRLSEIRKIIDCADMAYHHRAVTLIPDNKYNALKKELVKLCPGDERHVRFGPPQFGDAFAKIHHQFRIHEPAKFDTSQQIRDWYQVMLIKLVGNINISRRRVLVTMNVSGHGAVLYYKNGKLWRAATTSNQSNNGDNITANAIHFAGVPTQLSVPANTAVYGNIVIPIDNWYSSNMRKRGSDNKKICRDIIYGHNDVDVDKLSFVASDLTMLCGGWPDEIISEQHKLTFLHDQGFNVVEHGLFENIDDAIAWYDALSLRRRSLAYASDGVIFKMNDLLLQRDWATQDNVRCVCVAIDFEKESILTRLTGLVVKVNHDGAIVPFAKIDKITIYDSEIDCVPLNDFKCVRKLDLAIGDTVKIVAEPSSQIVGVAQRAANRYPIIEPTSCPACGRSIIKNKLKCANSRCPARARMRLKNWFSRTGINTITKDVITAFCKSGVVTITDFYQLLNNQDAVQKLAELSIGNNCKLGAERAREIIAQVDSKRQMPLDAFISSFGVPNLNKRIVNMIRGALPGHFDTVDDWICHNKLIFYADNLCIPGVTAAAITAAAISISALKDDISGVCAFINVI